MAFRPFSSLAGYRRSWLRFDLVGGLTIWAVLVPEALAYATIAGVSPVVGLYAAPGACSSTPPSAARALLVTGGDLRHGRALGGRRRRSRHPGGLRDPDARSLAVVTGLIALLAGVLRLGFLANFISEPVLQGFIVGLALTIIIGQLPKLFGIEGSSGDFFEKAWNLIRHLGQTDWATLAVGAGSLVLIMVLRRTAPRVPASPDRRGRRRDRRAGPLASRRTESR